MGLYDSDLLQLALRDKWASSPPLEQRASASLKNPWASFGAFKNVWKVDKLDYFVGPNIGVCNFFFWILC